MSGSATSRQPLEAPHPPQAPQPRPVEHQYQPERRAAQLRTDPLWRMWRMWRTSAAPRARPIRIISMLANGKQSRTMSLVEASTNVVVGYLLAVVTQFAVFPLFGLTVSVADNLVIGGIFTAVSLLRSFALRRLFES